MWKQPILFHRGGIMSSDNKEKVEKPTENPLVVEKQSHPASLDVEGGGWKFGLRGPATVVAIGVVIGAAILILKALIDKGGREAVLLIVMGLSMLGIAALVLNARNRN